MSRSEVSAPERFSPPENFFPEGPQARTVRSLPGKPAGSASSFHRPASFRSCVFRRRLLTSARIRKEKKGSHQQRPNTTRNCPFLFLHRHAGKDLRFFDLRLIFLRFFMNISKPVLISQRQRSTHRTIFFCVTGARIVPDLFHGTGAHIDFHDSFSFRSGLQISPEKPLPLEKVRSRKGGSWRCGALVRLRFKPSPKVLPYRKHRQQSENPCSPAPSAPAG